MSNYRRSRFSPYKKVSCASNRPGFAKCITLFKFFNNQLAFGASFERDFKKDWKRLPFKYNIEFGNFSRSNQRINP